MKTYSAIIAALLLSVGITCSIRADEFVDLLNRVEILKIHRNDYILGKVLTEKQKQTALRNFLEKANPGTYKFKDKDLYILADGVGYAGSVGLDDETILTGTCDGEIKNGRPTGRGYMLRSIRWKPMLVTR